MPAANLSSMTVTRFRHQAALYAGAPGFVEATVPFIREGVRAGEPVLVIVTADKIDLLRTELGEDAAAVDFADMTAVGRNPATIIPAWREFVAEHVRDDRGARGVGEPVHPERRAAELGECRRHEALLNHAFVDSPPWRLLCPYDTRALSAAVVAEARRTHPYIASGGSPRASSVYRGHRHDAAGFDEPLPEPPVGWTGLEFSGGDVERVRGLVAGLAQEAGLDPTVTTDVALAVHELAANSVRHGGGRGVIRIWRDDNAFVCEVVDRGTISDPMLGREHPDTVQPRGRGLWMVNQLCDLMQLRSFDGRTIARIHLWLDDRG